MTPKRSDSCDKWHRYCACGKKHHINLLKKWDGNECCPGETFSRLRPGAR